MKTSILITVAVLGWLLFALQVREHYRREPIVRLWADAAYDAGYRDGLTDASTHVTYSNKEFSTTAAINTYEGAGK